MSNVESHPAGTYLPAYLNVGDCNGNFDGNKYQCYAYLPTTTDPTLGHYSNSDGYLGCTCCAYRGALAALIARHNPDCCQSLGMATSDATQYAIAVNGDGTYQCVAATSAQAGGLAACGSACPAHKYDTLVAAMFPDPGDFAAGPPVAPGVMGAAAPDLDVWWPRDTNFTPYD